MIERFVNLNSVKFFTILFSGQWIRIKNIDHFYRILKPDGPVEISYDLPIGVVISDIVTACKDVRCIEADAQPGGIIDLYQDSGQLFVCTHQAGALTGRWWQTARIDISIQ